MIYSSFWSDGQKSSWTSRPVDERPPKDPKKTPLPRPGNSTSTPQISWWSTQQKRQARTVCGTEGKKHELRPFPNVLEPADKNPKEISKWQSTEMVGQGALRRNLTQSSKMPRESKPWIFMTTRVQMSSSDNIMDPGWLQIVKVGKGFPCCLSCRTAGQKPLETMSTGMFDLGLTKLISAHLESQACSHFPFSSSPQELRETSRGCGAWDLVFRSCRNGSPTYGRQWHCPQPVSGSKKRWIELYLFAFCFGNRYEDAKKPRPQATCTYVIYIYVPIYICIYT